MLCREIIDVIEGTYPKEAALAWDNVGLLVGRTEKEVKRIYVALDATDEIIEAAIRGNADMLVTHHPLIFSPLKTVTDEHFISNRVVKLLQHDISYYAMHTNYDVLGMAELSGKMMELVQAEPLEVTIPENNQGIGRVGLLKHEMTVGECCELVKEKFHLPDVKVFGDIERKVTRAAISPGSGKSMIDTALQTGAEVLVTGDIGHHEGIDAVARGLDIIDAGHYGLEHIFIEDMAMFLESHLSCVKIEKAEIVQPFQTV